MTKTNTFLSNCRAVYDVGNAYVIIAANQSHEILKMLFTHQLPLLLVQVSLFLSIVHYYFYILILYLSNFAFLIFSWYNVGLIIFNLITPLTSKLYKKRGKKQMQFDAILVFFISTSFFFRFFGWYSFIKYQAQSKNVIKYQK